MIALLVVARVALAQVPDGGAPPPADVITPPTAQCSSPPVYPESEEANALEGSVVVRVTIDEKGAPANLEVAKPFGPAFDAAALEAAKHCSYTAAARNGVPAPSLIEMKINFVPKVKPWVLDGVVVGELGEPLSGASVSYGDQQVLTDSGGHFSLTFQGAPQTEKAEQWVLVQKDGYSDKGFPETFAAGKSTHARYLLPKVKVLETRVEGSKLLPTVPEPDRTPQVSKYTITRADIDRTPGALEDVARVVQQVPGVAADPDLLASFYVRGGGPEEVVFYLDGVPLTNPYHLGGFASIFNPMLIESADFYAAGIPAQYEPALSGAFEVRYATGETKKFSGMADVSLQTAKLKVDIPLGIEGLSATLSARRSYFEAYFAALESLGVLGKNLVAPDITELNARINFRRGNHETTFTAMYAQDGLDFKLAPGDQPLINFAGGLKISNQVELFSLQHKVQLAGDSQVRLLAAYTHDINDVSVTSQRVFANNALHDDVVARADATWVQTEQHRTQLGVEYAYRALALTGQVSDGRDVAPWSQQPFADTHAAYLDINPAVKRDILAGYLEHVWRPRDWLSLQAGGRAQLDVRGAQWTGSANLAGAVTLPTQTVLKVSGGMASVQSLVPLYLDPTVGNPHLSPERTLTGVVGLEQPLPFEALLKLEVWGKLLDQLIVNPDTAGGVQSRIAAGQSVFTNDGKGEASGVDLLFLGRTRHFSYGISGGVLQSRRFNPLAAGAQWYPSPWDQRFTMSAHLSWSPSNKWLFTGRFDFRSGRPFTPVVGWARDERDGWYLPIFGTTNGDRYPNFYELSLRGERRFRLGPLEMAAYLEVLNVTNAQNVFAYIYGNSCSADLKLTPDQCAQRNFANGTEPTKTDFNHLPIRPFLGVRAEY